MGDVGFRSVVRTDILSERPATPFIILMKGSIGLTKRFNASPKLPPPFPGAGGQRGEPMRRGKQIIGSVRKNLSGHAHHRPLILGSEIRQLIFDSLLVVVRRRSVDFRIHGVIRAPTLPESTGKDADASQTGQQACKRHQPHG